MSNYTGFKILWLTPGQVQHFTTLNWSPVYEYDQSAKKYTDVQQVDTDSKLPIWQAKALARIDWAGEPALIHVRCASKTKPAAAVVGLDEVFSAGMPPAAAWEPEA